MFRGFSKCFRGWFQVSMANPGRGWFGLQNLVFFGRFLPISCEKTDVFFGRQFGVMPILAIFANLVPIFWRWRSFSHCICECYGFLMVEASKIRCCDRFGIPTDLQGFLCGFPGTLNRVMSSTWWWWWWWWWWCWCWCLCSSRCCRIKQKSSLGGWEGFFDANETRCLAQD